MTSFVLWRYNSLKQRTGCTVRFALRIRSVFGGQTNWLANHLPHPFAECLLEAKNTCAKAKRERGAWRALSGCKEAGGKGSRPSRFERIYECFRSVGFGTIAHPNLASRVSQRLESKGRELLALASPSTTTSTSSSSSTSSSPMQQRPLAVVAGRVPPYSCHLFYLLFISLVFLFVFARLPFQFSVILFVLVPIFFNCSAIYANLACEFKVRVRRRVRVLVSCLFFVTNAFRNCFSLCVFVFGSVEQFCLTDKCDAAVELEVAVAAESEVEVEAVATANAPQKSVNPFANSTPRQILLLLDCSDTLV